MICGCARVSAGGQSVDAQVQQLGAAGAATIFRETAGGAKTLWEALQASEYGFRANANPAVLHPRWGRASEEVLGTGERKPTLLFNGYGEQVAGLYKGLEKEALYI